MQAWVELIASHMNDLRRQPPLEGLLIVAPGRMLKDLRSALSGEIRVAGAQAHDLVSAPAHEIAGLLERALLDAEATLGPA